MRHLIYSDVHGNLPAFECMLDEVGTCDQYISLGDLVNYGPWSNECVELACSLPNSILLMGNHEEAFISGVYPGENQLVQSFFKTACQDFSNFDKIELFKLSHTLGDYYCTHTIDNQYVYPDTKLEINQNYIIGHSHHQFKYENNGYKLYNAGSVGQNRKFINEINYLIYDSDSSEIEMNSLLYDVDLLIVEMNKRKYPQECIDYYLTKARK